VAAADANASLEAVARQLDALGAALAGAGADRLQAETAALQRALAGAIGPLRRHVQAGGTDTLLRRRIAALGAQVAVQRELLARAGAATERALGVLLPAAAPPPGYGAGGRGHRPQTQPVAMA
jgi:hypothetical protein